MTKNSIKFFRFFSQKSVRFFEIKFFGSVEFYFLLILKFFRRQQTSSKNNHLRFCNILKLPLFAAVPLFLICEYCPLSLNFEYAWNAQICVLSDFWYFVHINAYRLPTQVKKTKWQPLRFRLPSSKWNTMRSIINCFFHFGTVYFNFLSCGCHVCCTPLLYLFS